MWKRMVIVTLVALLAIGVVVAKYVVSEGDIGDPTRVGQPSDVPQLVEFGATWCKGCEEMKPIMKELGREYRGRLDVFIVDVDEHGELAARFGVYILPYIVLLDTAGQVQFAAVGPLSKQQLVEVVREAGVGGS